MSAWKLDPVLHDRVRVAGQFVRVGGADEALQTAKTRLLLIRSEAWLNTEAGVDYFDLVFVKGTPLSLIENEFVEAIASTPGVTQVDLDAVFDDTVVTSTGQQNPTYLVTFTAIFDSADQLERRQIQGEFRVPGGEITA